MKVSRTSGVLKKLRDQPLWRLLAASKSTTIIAVLHSLLMESDKVLPSSVLTTKLAETLNALRDAGEDFPQTAQVYIADWMREGWLTRRLAPGADQEEYELTPDASAAIRFTMGIAQPRRIATESRLTTVLSRISDLATDTNTDIKSRMDALYAERARIDAELDDLARGKVKTLPEDRALERLKEIIFLADDLAADFHHVRAEFERLNRQLRANLLERTGTRGEVLEDIFEEVDNVSQSEAGRTFFAFWNLLIDPQQSTILLDALEDLTQKPFASKLDAKERRFLRDLKEILLMEGQSVHNALQTFARGLKTFVQSREFQEHRRIMSTIRSAQLAALEVKESLRYNQEIGMELTLSTSTIRSVTQWQLHDPSDAEKAPPMQEAVASEISLDSIASLVKAADIDMRTLRSNIKTALELRNPVFLSELIQDFGSPQGLGTVIGYLHIGVKQGMVDPAHKATITWTGMDGVNRCATVPHVTFYKDTYK